MPVKFSNRVVLPTGTVLAVCTEAIRQNDTQIMAVSVMECCVKKISPCITQGAAKVLQFRDADTEDYSGATEITFDVWQGGIGGTSLLSYSLTGSDLTLANDYTFQVTIDNADSLSLPAGSHHCEAWVTLAGGERRCVGLGRFKVIDSRKHDA